MLTSDISSVFNIYYTELNKQKGISMEKDNIDLMGISLIKLGGVDREKGVRMLYEKYAKILRKRFFRITKTQADADDLVQETFIKIVTGCNLYSGVSPFSAWIGSIAKNCLIDHLRHKKNFNYEGLDDEGWELLERELEKNNGERSKIEKDERSLWLIQNHNSDPYDEIDNVENCVKNAFKRFFSDDKERANALTLVVEGYDIKKIANLIQRTEAATREYLSQCRKKIQPYMAPCLEYLNN